MGIEIKEEVLYSKIVIFKEKRGDKMLNIQRNELYIKDIFRAVISQLPRRFIPMGTPRVNEALIYTIAGSCRYELADGTAFIAGSGDVMFLSRGVDYSMEILTDEYRYIPCVFLLDTDQSCESMLIRPDNTALFDSLFHKLAGKHSVTGPGQKQLCMALLYQICAAIMQNGKRDYVPGSARLRVEKARTYIQSNIHDPGLRVADLARKAEMSEVHFRKLFMSLYRMSPSAYMMSERVNYAKELMTLSELRLEDVAIQSGFSSLAHMCKVFKTVVGVTPGIYRARHM